MAHAAAQTLHTVLRNIEVGELGELPQPWQCGTWRSGVGTLRRSILRTWSSAVPRPGTTTQIVYPASPVAAGTAVTLYAGVTPPIATGSVQFKDGTTNIGNPVTVTNGTASTTTSTLAVGPG